MVKTKYFEDLVRQNVTIAISHGNCYYVHDRPNDCCGCALMVEIYI